MFIPKLWLRDAVRRPGQTAFLLLSLTVSLAGAVAALSLNAVVSWRDLPFTAASSLVKLEVRSHERRSRWWSWPELQAVGVASPDEFQGVAGYTVADVTVTSEPGRPPEALLGTLVSPDFFAVLGGRASLGRLLRESDHHTGSHRVVLLSHELWERRYGRDPEIVGRFVDLSTPAYLGEDGGPHLVIGVLAPETWLFWRRFDVVTPLRADAQRMADPQVPLVEHVIARLAPDATASSVRPHAPALTAALRAVSGSDRTQAVTIEALRSALFRDLQPKLRLVLAIAILVFALAGLNVLVAATSAALERERETAIRLGLGATPQRLAAGAGLYVALTGMTASLLSLPASGVLTAFVLAYLPDAWLARVPGGAAAVTPGVAATAALILMTVAVGTLSALWSAFHLGRLPVANLLQASHHDDRPRRQRWRAVLVGSEVAVGAAVLLVATTLGLQLWKLRSVDLGIRADRTVALWINPGRSAPTDPVSRSEYYARIAEELGRVPGVEAVGAIDLTFQFDWQTTNVRAGYDREQAPIVVLDRVATPNYLDVAGLRLMDGRWFEDRRDRRGGDDIAVVSQSLAEVLWPRQRAVGQTVRLDAGATDRAALVVGVVSDIRHAPEAPVARVVYRSATQAPPPWLYYLVRFEGAPQATPALQAAVWRVNPDQPVDGPWSVQSWMDERTAYMRFLATIAAVLTSVAIVLAVAGLNALTLFWVGAARRELGIRRALGAGHGDILHWFARRWAVVVLPALIVGVLLQSAIMVTAASQIEAVRSPSLTHLACGTLAVLLYTTAAAAAALIRALRTDGRVLVQ